MPIRVLIADDHAVFRSGLKALLEKEPDMEVVGEAGDGKATLEAVDHHRFEVLLLDLSMPKLSGSQVAEHVLKKQPGLAIVVLTMHEDEYYMQELFKIGARAFVLKKSTGTQLIEAIRIAHQGKQFIDPALAGRVISSYVGRPFAKNAGVAKNAGAKKVEDRLELLTPREREVCTLLAYGHTNVEIAEKLFISERTIETHRTHILSKLQIKSRAELVRFAIDHGLLKFG